MERNRGGRPRHPDVLTPAEWRVLEELRKGGTNAEIAVRLGVSPDAVKYHISNMLGQLGLLDRHELGAWQPATTRDRFRALLATPVSLALFGRPLWWAGAGAVALAGIAVVAILLVIPQGNGEPGPLASPPTPLADTPTPGATVPPTPTGAPTLTPAAPLTLADCSRIEAPPVGDEPCLIVVSDGTVDALILEWAGGPAGATGWQYRASCWDGSCPPGEWTDVPHSGPSTRTYRLTGLRSGTGYVVELRALVGTAPGPGSSGSRGKTQEADGRHPEVERDYVVQGDGRTEWRIGGHGWLDWAFTIPDRMRLRGRVHAWSNLQENGLAVSDIASGSLLVLSWTEGAEVGRTIVTPGEGSRSEKLLRDVHERFDQIVASVRESQPAATPSQPPPSNDRLALVVVPDGAAGAVTLKWPDGPANATKWQYRTRTWANQEPQPWSDWTDIPVSDGAAHSYRLTGLTPGTSYDAQVRAFEGERVIRTSRYTEVTAQPDNDLPALDLNVIFEGDGATQWRLSGGEHVVVIPEGMRIRKGRGNLDWWGRGIVTAIYDVETNSALNFFSSELGPWVWFGGRRVEPPVEGAPAWDVHALFDQIEGSLTRVPVPSPVPVVLTAIATGGAGELLLEWTGDSVDADGWEYRQRRDGGDWGAWHAIPNSVGATRDYLLTGLTPGTAYQVQVRAIAGGSAGATSKAVRGSTPEVDTNGIPVMTQMMLGQTIEGGLAWRLGGYNGEFFDTVVDVPTGMRLVRYTLLAPTDKGWGIQLVDVESYSYLVVDVATGEELDRRLLLSPGDPDRDVGALFDQIIDSARPARLAIGQGSQRLLATRRA